MAGERKHSSDALPKEQQLTGNKTMMCVYTA